MVASRDRLTRFAWLSIAAAVATIALKFVAFWITGSVGLLSDAAESVVNLVAAVVALVALTVAARPADDSHPFGHTKAEYLSAVFEGVLIFVAAVYIVVTAVQRLVDPVDLTHVGIGLAISVAASVVNGLVGLLLVRVGRRHRSLTLEADGRHLLTDVWTSAGVVVGVLLVAVTGWLRLDPIVAILVGLNIVRTGWQLIHRSVGGLMDQALEPEAQARIDDVLRRYACDEVRFHAIRTREAGHRSFLSLHVLVPGEWSVTRGHDLVEDIERDLLDCVDHLDVSTHLEPMEDPRSYEPHLGVARPDLPDG